MPSLYSKVCPEIGHPPSEPRQIKITVTEEQFREYYLNRLNIQQVLADQPATIRERFTTGICGICWDAIFADSEEDEG